jgi:excisionase family DNA binding protein
MNKKEVAEFLGVSIRRVEQFDSQKRLGEKTYQKGKTGKEAHFQKEAVEKLKTELNSTDTAIATNSLDARLFVSSLIDAISNREQPHKEAVRTSEKLLLNVNECRGLTGLSEDRIYDALDSGKLKGKKNEIGRGWKIKRKDLDEFINNL